MNNKEFYKLTTPQKSIFLTEQYYNNTNINNISGYLHICEPVNIDKLELAINRFIKENEQFRARFFKDEKQILNQYYASYKKEKIEVIKLKDIEQKEKIGEEFGNKRFNLIEKKLYRFCIYQLENGEGGILFSAHHMICDAWTISLLINSIINSYSEKKIEQKEEYQYKNYILDEEKYYKSDKYAQNEQYWKTIFSDSIELKNKNLQKEDISAKRIETTIDNKLVEKALIIDKSFFNIYLSALSVYFGKINNLKNIIIGTPILNRKNYTEKQIAGMFVNTLPLKIDIDRNITFREFLRNNKQNEMQLFKHQKMPYDRIMKIVRETNPEVNNLFDITVSYQNARDNHKDADIKYNTGWFFNGCISDALDVHITDLDNLGKFKIMYDYQTSQFEENEVLKIHNRIINILQQVTENENILIRDIEIVTEKELKEINKINSNIVKIPENSNIVKLFKEQVKKRPNKIAISFEENEITYNELDIKSDKITSVLQKKGIKKSDIVAIFLPKSLEFFINMLGILKAGATYLPLDVEFPDTRVNYILNDSKAKMCITNEDEKDRITTQVDKITNEEIEKNALKNIRNDVDILADDSCYVIYTSGTTRRTKRSSSNS